MAPSRTERKRDHWTAVAQTALARSVTPTTKIAASNLVISQSLRMTRLNCLTAPSRMATLKVPLWRVEGEACQHC